jgi:hypothetical protein
MIAARLSRGAVSQSSSSHLPPIEASKLANPVMFPLGRSSRATMLLATGSLTPKKTIGIVRVSRWTAAVAAVPFVAMMSGCEPTNSCTSARIRLLSSRPHRRSIRTLRPSVQPESASARVNAESRFHRPAGARRSDAPAQFAVRAPAPATPPCSRAPRSPAVASLISRLIESVSWLGKAGRPRFSYSMISSARSRIDCGTVSPSDLAVLRFTAISSFVGNCTGRSPGFPPRRMRST